MFFDRITFALFFFLSLCLSVSLCLSSCLCFSLPPLSLFSSLPLLLSCYLSRTLANFLIILVYCSFARLPTCSLVVSDTLSRGAQATRTDHAHAVGRRHADSVPFRIAVCDHRSAVPRLSHTCQNTGLRSPHDLRSRSPFPDQCRSSGAFLDMHVRHRRSPVTAPPLLWRPSISPPRPSQTEKKRTGAHPTRCDNDNDDDTLIEDGPNMCSASWPCEHE